MRLIVCAVAMMIGGAWAHYYRSYTQRDLEFPKKTAYSEKLQRYVDYVRCPVCESYYRDGIRLDDGCPVDYKTIDGVNYRECENGSYFNKRCNQWDCYRGAGEQCSREDSLNKLGKECAPGYTCIQNQCEGLKGKPAANAIFLKNPLLPRLSFDKLERSDFNLENLIRQA